MPFIVFLFVAVWLLSRVPEVTSVAHSQAMRYLREKEEEERRLNPPKAWWKF